MNAAQFSHWLAQKSQCTSTKYSEKPLIMGVVNVTPDSFSDGGKFLAPTQACEHALRLVEQGADLIDIGGESSKPGAEPVPLDVELARVIPVIEQLRLHSSVCISIDTHKPQVMQAAVQAGADVINDIHALQSEGALDMAAELSVPICLMHMKGLPETMQNAPSYTSGVIPEVHTFFEERLLACARAGIERQRLILDPGFGFGKTNEHNLSLMRQFEDLHRLNQPLLLGVSRKSTLGSVLQKEVNQRLIGGLVLALYAALKGVALLRTHDVEETHQALTMLQALEESERIKNEMHKVN
jgi:dihydropteroate synthase